jgi:hypothetical protein
MALFEGESTRVVDKFNGENFNLWKFKMEMVLASMDLWDIHFIRRKFFTCKMQEGEDLLDHINRVKALAHQLACLEVPVRDEDVVMTLLESLLLKIMM